MESKPLKSELNVRTQKDHCVTTEQRQKTTIDCTLNRDHYKYNHKAMLIKSLTKAISCVLIAVTRCLHWM